MKAFMVYEPGRFELVDMDVPPIAEDEVLVRVGAAAICHSDIDIIEGRRKHQIKFPLIPGHEFAGSVVEVGKLASGITPGDRVVCENIVWCGRCHNCRNGHTSYCENMSELGSLQNGGFAEYAAIPAKNALKFSSISMEEAANVEPAGNAYHAVEAAGIQPGDTVVVIGPGPIGLFALQHAKLKCPGKLIMVGTREERLNAALVLGATHTVNVRREDALDKIMELTGGGGADKVLQCATKTDAFELAFKIAAPFSTVVIEGLDDNTAKMDIEYNEFIYKCFTVRGVGGVTTRMFENTLRLMEQGCIDAKPIITHCMPLKDIKAGIDLINARGDSVIKVVVNP